MNDHKPDRSSMPESTLAQFAALEPLADPPPEPVALLLDATELAAIGVRAEALVGAREAARAADVALGEAKALARQIDGLQARSGALAAKAFSGVKADKQAVQSLNAELERCQQARIALPTLEAEAAEAHRLRDAALGGLQVLTAQCMGSLRQRAADEYTRLAGEMLKCVAAIGTTLELQPRVYAAEGSGWATMFMSSLNVPAVLDSLRNRRDAQAVENLHFRDTLLSFNHGRLRAASSGCRSNLLVQLQASLAPCGLQPSNVL
jgi:hypothetical protein